MSRQNFFSLVLLISFGASPSIAQESIPFAAQCTDKALAALRPLPQLVYDCPANLNDSDESILKLPVRIDGLRKVTAELESFTNPAWWQTDIRDLNLCEIHGSPGELTPEEKDKLRMGGDYDHRLFGDDRFRMIIVFDPCYQTGFNGSNLFLLYRQQGKVFVTPLMDGFYTRIENAIDMHLGWLAGQPIIEIGTGNSMPTRFVNYYFTIDPKTNKAIQKKLFKVGGKFTNELHSAVLLVDPVLLGLPADAVELKVIRNKRLVKSFGAFEFDEHGKIDSLGQKLRRIVYRWNGRFYLHSPR